MPNRRNQYDNRDCLERGESAELQFTNIIRSRGWEVIPATREQDIYEHWDILIKKADKKYKVDIKGMKRINRKDDAQDDWIWIELHGVREYDEGWLYGSSSDIIAFEKRDSFIMVERSNLIDLIPRIIDLESRVYSSFNAKYKVYHRPGRPDKITLIETKQIEPIKCAEWEKMMLIE
ncbi:hypothetical protein ANME2D_02236 [Candidatus Methanoperedens nitroreducens]|uniref:Uncharacterized protein n=1 Tax=Candidatus Methanoperedens nitratireducens TaxID=1392998 RepID=A0A062V815_9EURY|nr:hypothetical protein [Candidatus Methanoperedens nitroreducens]KCZ71505.1 hypothetical protein ANME2D_02236 [Candidatus Methanoperedens nitroreducens]MDJ1421133.1 hypothetical protein [Candidatus Methanoperedens sp.]